MHRSVFEEHLLDLREVGRHRRVLWAFGVIVDYYTLGAIRIEAASLHERDFSDRHKI
jgi:hypothetical protein